MALNCVPPVRMCKQSRLCVCVCVCEGDALKLGERSRAAGDASARSVRSHCAGEVIVTNDGLDQLICAC